MSAPSEPAEPKRPENKSQALEWTKVVLLPMVTLLVTLVGGYYFSNLSKSREARESSERLYAQLLTQREQSDAQIRKDMFEVVISGFLQDTKPPDWNAKVLQLELLANNFSQSLDLAPLFKDVARQLGSSADVPAKQSEALRKRLDQTAANLIFKQVNTLARRGFTRYQSLGLADWQANFGKPVIDETILTSNLVPITDDSPAEIGEKIRFAVEIVDVSHERREVEVRLRVMFPEGSSHNNVDRHFWVGQYDFPMLDNTQLPHGLRTSVVTTDFFLSGGNSFVTLHLVVFPAASASFKERQDYDDILLDMLRVESSRSLHRNMKP
jgi:hypothetical protein